MSARALYAASASARLQVAVFPVVLLHCSLGFDPQGLDFNTVVSSYTGIVVETQLRLLKKQKASLIRGTGGVR